MRQPLRRGMTEAELRKLLREAIDLLTPGSYAKANGYIVPSGIEFPEAWVIAKVKLLRRAGQTKLANYFIQYELEMLEARDWSDGTKRADAFRRALDV